MPRKTRPGGKFYVGDDSRTFETVNAAISLAITITLAKPKGETGSVYVRETGGQGPVARVENIEGVAVAFRLK